MLGVPALAAHETALAEGRDTNTALGGVRQRAEVDVQEEGRTRRRFQMIIPTGRHTGYISDKQCWEFQVELAVKIERSLGHR